MKPEANKPVNLRTPKWVQYKFKQFLRYFTNIVGHFIFFMKGLSAEILTLLNDKSEAAFEVVFNVFYSRLVAFAMQYVSEDEAYNSVQDAFVALFDKKSLFNNENQLQSYLYTNVKNNCLMFLRHEKVKKKYLDLKNGDDKQFILNMEALERLNTSPMSFMEIEQIINDTLEQLPPRCREIFVLSRMEGKKNVEVAALFNISEKAVEAQITKALKVFKLALRDYIALLVFMF